MLFNKKAMEDKVKTGKYMISVFEAEDRWFDPAGRTTSLTVSIKSVTKLPYGPE